MIPAAHVIFVLDDSGSMEEYAEITARAFDAMVETLQLCKGADIVMSLIKYGGNYRTAFSRRHIQLVEPIKYDPKAYHTAIRDALMGAIELAKKNPREEKTIIIIQTDGHDNASRRASETVRKEVLAAKKAGTEFLFMDASRGYYLCAPKLGFDPMEIMQYGGSDSIAAFTETAVNIGSVASRLTEHAAYTKEQLARVKK